MPTTKADLERLTGMNDFNIFEFLTLLLTFTQHNNASKQQ
jgi:hypothetical protein